MKRPSKVKKLFLIQEDDESFKILTPLFKPISLL